MIRRAESASSTEEGAVRCLIADDTDLPKRGMAIELVSRIFSHVTHSKFTVNAPIRDEGRLYQQLGLARL